MAPVSRRSTATVEERIFREPERFDVFQLVRLLRIRDSLRPGRAPRIRQRLLWRLMSGEADTRSFAHFARRLRFAAELSPAFPGTEVTRCLPLRECFDELRLKGLRAGAAAEAARLDLLGTEAVELRTPNYCVASELGPLPEPFVEWVRERMKDDDRTFAAFLNLFNHRINVLRHQAKATQEVALDYALPQDTRQADCLASLAGIVSPDAEAQIALPRRAWLGMTATLADPRRAAAPALVALRQYLGVPNARLAPLVGAWRQRTARQWMRLGSQASLGSDAVLGTHIWNQMAGVYLRVPDIDYAKLCALLPPPWQAPAVPAAATGPQSDEQSGTRSDTQSGVHSDAQSGGRSDAQHDALPDAQSGSHSDARMPAPPEGAAEPAPVSGYAGLAQMIRLLFDRRVDCVVTLTTRAAGLPLSLLSAHPGTGATASDSPQMGGTLPADVRYYGLRLGQTAWLAARARPADGMRHVRFTVPADPTEGGA